jgi:hypothetical protein
VGIEPKDEDDSTRLRWFAKRVADMKWWGENSKAEQPSEPAPASEEPQATSEDAQPPTGDRLRGDSRRLGINFSRWDAAFIFGRLFVRRFAWRALRSGDSLYLGAALDLLDPLGKRLVRDTF